MFEPYQHRIFLTWISNSNFCSIGSNWHYCHTDFSLVIPFTFKIAALKENFSLRHLEMLSSFPVAYDGN